MKKRRLFLTGVFFAISSSMLLANSNIISLRKTIILNNTTSPMTNGVLGGANTEDQPKPTKEITLVQLSQKEQDYVKAQAIKALNNESSSASNFSAATNSSQNTYYVLGNPVYANGYSQEISKMPVLDQAQTETCSTFSTTEALDIICGGATDYYNILDALYFGYYLYVNNSTLASDVKNEMSNIGLSSFPNPWNGSCEDLVLAKDYDYGLIVGQAPNDNDGSFQLNDQKTALDPNSTKEKNAEVYPSFSYNLLFNSSNPVDSKSQLIEDALNNGELVVIGIPVDQNPNGPTNGMTENIYPDANTLGQFDIGSSGAGGFVPDVWGKTSQINQDLANGYFGGHNVLVIGYIDGSANGYGSYFIIRNSWGPKNGSSGDNFASFSFVDTYATSATAVYAVNSES